MECDVAVDVEIDPRYTIMEGAQFVKDGVLNFPEPKNEKKKVDGSYRSMFGPCLSHDARIFVNSNRTVSIAFAMRTMRTRGSYAEERAHKARQAVFICTDGRFITDMMRHHYSCAFNVENTFSVDAARLHHADPHQKRLPRIAAFRELQDTGVLAHDVWVRKAIAKLKKNEWAKGDSKPGRIIVDYTIAASLQGFWATGIIKNLMAHHPLDFNGGHCHFIKKPTTSVLQHHFEKLIFLDSRFHFIYFSDDSCLAVKNENGAFGKHDVYNVDISKCDVSHGNYMFEALLWITPKPLLDHMRQLIEQMRLPYKVYDVNDRLRRVVIQFWTVKLGSGNTATTLINNLANVFLCYSISQEVEFTRETITAACARVGYIVTLEKCNQMEDIQFLKHSPVFATSPDGTRRIQPLLNLGVMLRASGTCKGDLPGRGDIETRARQFQAALLQGMYPRATFPLLNNLRRQTLAPTARGLLRVQNMLKYKKDNDLNDTFSVTPEDLYRRYRLRPDQIAVIDAVFGRCGPNDHYTSSAVTEILRRDYGLGSSTFPEWTEHPQHR